MNRFKVVQIKGFIQV